jgi:capsule biosynthesis phosphatase
MLSDEIYINLSNTISLNLQGCNTYMIIIIPIGGIGERFKEHGYKKPKALIHIYGKPIISYVLENLNISQVDYVFIPYNKEYKSYRFEDYLTTTYPYIKFKFLCLDNNTRGAAETIHIGLSQLNDVRDVPVLCLDSDNFYNYDIVSDWNRDNSVFSFEDSNDHAIYSYVSVNENDEIIDIKEKDKISNHACTGAYGFKSIHELKKYTSKIIQENKTQKSEFYTSGVIKEMIQHGNTFKNNNVERSNFVCLGTPLQMKFFYNNYPRKNSLNDELTIKNKRFCFDLDNTLVTYPTVKGDYTTVKPIEQNINFLKYLKSFGNTIIIYTARRMKTHNGNIGKINSDIGKITFETLDKLNIPYDEIYFGKPYADFYIDDLAINCFDDLEKELGYYNNKIEPRDFNIIHTGSVNTIIKHGDLRGERYYYENIPVSLKDLFPIYLSGNDTSITIEKINGVTVTDLYLSEMLNENTFIHILNSIVRIQKCNSTTNSSEIYDNYASKLIHRYENYDYSSYHDSKNVYDSIVLKLLDYEKNNKGKKTIIHGDPVFTNIIINDFGKIKFIDMRGRMGDTLTIYGDWLYDWAKIYQSIIGYDEILISKTIDKAYKQRMVDIFKHYFMDIASNEDFGNLKTITKSLIFSLIPLHHNEKCASYYNLLRSEYLCDEYML